MSDAKRIMIVDDDPDVLEQLSVLLRPEGFEVLTAGSQAEGEELLLSAKPDLAILDLMMENADSGLVLAYYLKNIYPQTPVVILTAFTAASGISLDSSSKESQSWLKADLLLDKPVRPEQILAQVRRLLHMPEPAAAHAHH